MKISHTHQHNLLQITPEIPLIDHKIAGNFKARCHELIAKENYPDTLLNLECVNFIDSSGFSAIISILKGLANHKSDLLITGLNPAITEIFKLTQMNKIFRIFPSIAAAQNAKTLKP